FLGGIALRLGLALLAHFFQLLAGFLAIFGITFLHGLDQLVDLLLHLLLGAVLPIARLVALLGIIRLALIGLVFGWTVIFLAFSGGRSFSLALLGFFSAGFFALSIRRLLLARLIGLSILFRPLFFGPRLGRTVGV